MFPPTDGSDTSESSCALSVLPEILITVASFGSLWQYIAPMSQKPDGTEILSITGSCVCLHDPGSVELLGECESTICTLPCPDAITTIPGALGGRVTSALGKSRWPLMFITSPGNQASYTFIRHFSIRDLVLSYDPRAKVTDNPWYPSVRVPAVLRDLKYQMSYISENLANRKSSQLPNHSGGVPSQSPDPGSGKSCLLFDPQGISFGTRRFFGL